MNVMENKRLVLAAFTALIAVCLLTAVSVAKAGQANTVILDARLDVLSCRIDFASVQIDLIRTDIAGAPDLSTDKVKIQAGIGQLKAYASSGDKENFSKYVVNNLAADMKTASEHIQAVKKDYKKYNISKQEKQTIKAAFKYKADKYRTCMNSTTVANAKQALKAIDKWIDNAQKRIDQLKGKGYDTSGLSAIVADAKGNYQTLSDAIATKDAKKVSEAATEVRDKHLHYCANFRGAELTLYIEKLEGIDTNKKYTAALDQAGKEIDAALAIAVPGHEYTEGEFAAVWTDLNKAGKTISDTAKSIKGKKQAKKTTTKAGA